MFPKAILRNVYKSADYSKSFIARIDRIHEQLVNKISLHIRKRYRQDYSVSSFFTIYLDGNWSATDTVKDATYKIQILISSKGRYYTYICSWSNITNDAPKTWRRFDNDNLNINLIEILDDVQVILRGNGYTLVTGPVLQEIVPDLYTDLDSVPATLMDVLFAEIV